VIELLKECKYLVGTSANVSGETSNLSVSEVVASSLRGFDAILDGGITKEGKESTVIEVSGEVPQIIREGTVPVDLIKQAISIASD
jgi:L-threonylcarbamoyladenylate synthase